ncbi:MAG: hypothetical protein GX410_10365 [Elusimicrobia bacterium]|nr:hypothetical protein [Elusimicrobiota bacterium]
MEAGLFLSLTGLCALASFLELDAVYAGQFLLSRPLVVGTLLGLICGDVKTGVQFGIWTEFLLLDQLPVGGYVPPSGGVCAASAFILAYLCMLPVSFSFLLGIIIGKGYSHMESRLRTWRNAWNRSVEKDVQDDAGAVNAWMFKSIALQFGAGFVFIWLAVQALSLAGAYAWPRLSEELRNAVDLGYFAVPWIGMASLVFTLYAKAKAAAHA